MLTSLWCLALQLSRDNSSLDSLFQNLVHKYQQLAVSCKVTMSIARRDFELDRQWPGFSGRGGDAPFGFSPYMPLSRHGWGYDAQGWPGFHRNTSPWMMQARQRFMDMERKFEQFMRNVDERFTGMLSLVDVKDDFDTNLRIPVQHEGKALAVTESSNKGCLRLDINVQDFKPEEVTVKVTGGKVFVHAKRETKNEDNGMYAYTFREFKRAFTLPEGMKTEDVKSSLSSDGILKIEGSHDVAADRLSLTGEIPVVVEHKTSSD